MEILILHRVWRILNNHIFMRAQHPFSFGDIDNVMLQTKGTAVQKESKMQAGIIDYVIMARFYDFY
jgi:hypothetical protein